MITYLGQAAYLMANPDQVGSTFFASIPFGDGFYWCFFVIATAAACVASQACSHPNPKPSTSPTHWFGAIQLPLATLPSCSMYRQSHAGLAACF